MASKTKILWVCINHGPIVLGNIKYCNILFEYRGNLVSKYCASIFIIFIDFIYVTDEVYSLDMSTKVTYPMILK